MFVYQPACRSSNQSRNGASPKPHARRSGFPLRLPLISIPLVCEAGLASRRFGCGKECHLRYTWNPYLGAFFYVEAASREAFFVFSSFGLNSPAVTFALL